jgi:hypothetical protein
MMHFISFTSPKRPIILVSYSIYLDMPSLKTLMDQAISYSHSYLVLLNGLLAMVVKMAT